MAIEARLGRTIFSLGFIAIGVASLWLGLPVMRLEVWLKAWPHAAEVGRISGAIVLVCGAALLVDRWAKAGAAALAVVLLVWLLALHVPLWLPTFTHGDRWSGVSECLAVFGAAWVLAALLPPHAAGWQRIADLGIPAGRICFGLALLIFGAMHFVYHDFVAGFIPDWIPERSFLAYATGVAHIAAGLAILSGILPRLAAVMAAIMYASWVVILHIPRALVANDPFEWNGVFVAAILSAGALLVAASFAPSRDAKPR